MNSSYTFLASLGLLTLAASPAWAIPLPGGNSYSAAHAVAGPQQAGGARQLEAGISHQTPFVRAEAYASLRTGTLQARAWSSDSTSPEGCAPAAPDCRWGTTATAAVWDVLLLTRNGSSATSVPWSFHIDGRSGPGPWAGEASANAYIYLGNNELQWRNPARHTLDGDDTFSGSIQVTGDSAWVYLYAGLEVSAGQGAWADYSNAMQFSWQLPEGWTLWSQSGQFMAGAPVPEPGSGALLAGGGALLAWLTRRRRTARGQALHLGLGMVPGIALAALMGTLMAAPPAALAAGPAGAAAAAPAPAPAPAPTPSAAPQRPPASQPVALGRYLVQTTGCNDCHTAGYAASSGRVPEKDWLIGDPLGWRGPWGTSYATNLRLHFSQLTEAQWLAQARHMQARPPMPWFALREMADDDLRAIYRYVRAAGPAGQPAPAALPPGAVPRGPYVQFPQ